MTFFDLTGDSLRGNNRTKEKGKTSYWKKESCNCEILFYPKKKKWYSFS